MTDYRPMWRDLGMDLSRHDQLLELLSSAYSQTFLTQRNRPDGMAYLDFVIGEAHGLRIKELVDHKSAGGWSSGPFAFSCRRISCWRPAAS
jgi:hypothetical protein